jgi:hypothetical protein
MSTQEELEEFEMKNAEALNELLGAITQNLL